MTQKDQTSMKNKLAHILFLSLFAAGILVVIIGCRNSTPGNEPANSPNKAALTFSLKLDPEVYTKSHYKKPPQFAVWLEDPLHKTIRTVWVTQCTGRGNWGNNIVRPISLPYWVSRWNLETQCKGDPTPENPTIDAVTGATPKDDFIIETKVTANSVWYYYIEINTSGDYNDAFPVKQKDGRRDLNGNGQPSIIYKGRITSLPGQKSIPELIGRTDQLQNVKQIIDNLDGITTARKLLSEIEVSCQ